MNTQQLHKILHQNSQPQKKIVYTTCSFLLLLYKTITTWQVLSMLLSVHSSSGHK